MPYREKVAWLSLVAIAVTFGPYFAMLALAPPPEAPLPNLRLMRLFGATVVAQALILGAGHLVFRLRAPDDARAPADERDRAIERRSVRVAYYVLITGIILVGCIMPFNAIGWTLVNAAVAAIVVAELVHYGIAVWSYRRGWHD